MVTALTSGSVRPVIVVDALRTPIDGRGGRLSGWHPADLAGEVLRALADRSGFDPGAVDDVLLGCAMPVGSQGFNLARSAALAAGWPERVPGGTIDRQALSSIAAVAAGAHTVASGFCDLVIAGGVEVMSTTPYGATLVPGAMPFGPAVAERYREAGGLVPAGVAADRLAGARGYDRAHLDELACRSHARAAAVATRPEVLPVASRVLDRDKGEVVSSGTSVTADALPRSDLTTAELAAFQPLFAADGVVTAGNAAPAADGAAALVLASEAAAARLDRQPLASIARVALVGADPVDQFSGAVGAATRVLDAGGCRPAELLRIELAEPFAAVVAAWAAGLGLDVASVNPEGGGIAIGEPTGATGAVLVAAVAHAVAGRAGASGLAAIGGSGLGGAVLLRS